MNIAIMRDLPAEQMVSMERYADALVDELRSKPGNRVVESFGPTGHAWLVRRLPRRMRIYYGRYLAYPFSVRKLPADICHIVDHSYGHLLASLPATRTVVTCHDLMTLTATEWLGRVELRPRALTFRYSIFYLRRAAHVIAISQATRNDLIRHGLVAPDRVSVVQPGLAPAFVHARSHRTIDDGLRQTLLRPGESTLLLHLGTCAAYKNLPTVLCCLAELRRRGERARLLRVGAPFSQPLRKLAADLGVDKFVTELGSMRDADLASIYRTCNVLLFPSLKEGFGWPPIEAMACGLPVVASTAAALVESLGDAALYADARDVGGLATACQRLMHEPQVRLRQIALGLARSERFDWQSACTAIMEIYDNVLQRSRGGRGSIG